jgi:hypothetical protein
MLSHFFLAQQSQVSYCNLTHVPSDICRGVELLDYMAGLFLVFLRSLRAIFHSAYTNLCSYQLRVRPPFSHILTNIFCCSCS